MFKQKFLASIIILIILSWALPVLPAQAQSQPFTPKIQTRFIAASGISLEQLVSGAAGEGTLLYYLPDNGPEKPALVVRLNRVANTGIPQAQVYQAPSDLSYVPIRLQADKVDFERALEPSITIQSLDGWWSKDNRPSYNLDIQIKGPMYAMWGADYDTKNLIFRGWPTEVKANEPSVAIRVRDPQHTGVPQWDLRQLLPAFPGKGYLRTNYAERKCNTPLEFSPGVSSLWPYIAENGGYEQVPGKLNAPIVVDWSLGRITYFSELVTVRNQNCSYSLYSLNALEADKLNQANFETPFAFYDLSGQGRGYPNLVLRTEHFPSGDKFSADMDPRILQGRPISRDFETIRYSWRNAVGDSRWDYKIDVLGFEPYNSDTVLADSGLRIDAPSYEQFPAWIVNRSWPAATFVSMEGREYISSEGIYDWSPRELGVGYLFGWDDQPKLEAFNSIGVSLRGEYRFNRDSEPRLYFSTVDRKLHMLKAEGGIWNIDGRSRLHYASLNSAGYIDQWTYVALAQPSNVIRSSRQLNVSPTHLLYTDYSDVIIRQAQVEPAVFELAPPTDRASWEALQKKLNENKRDFTGDDLLAMLNQFNGPELTISKAKLSEYRPFNNGFRFILSLEPGYSVKGASFLKLDNLQPGDYVVTYNQNRFTIEALTPYTITAKIEIPNLNSLERSSFNVTLHNAGLQDFPQASLELWATPLVGMPRIIARKSLDIFAKETTQLSLVWTPPTGGQWKITPLLRQPNGTTLSFETQQVKVQVAKSAANDAVVSSSASSDLVFLLLAGMFVFATLVALIFWQQWRVIPARQVQDGD